MKQENNNVQHRQILLFIGIIIVAFNLRPAITSVGPIIGMVRDDIGFPNWAIAFLTSLPLIAFAIMSPLVPRIANRWTNEITLTIGLLILIIGISLRTISLSFFLFTGTLLIGLGIAVLNVLLPGVIKENFPAKVALMTSLYTTSMSIFATAGSAVSVPIAEGMDLGWQWALFIWVLPAIIAFILWLFILKGKKGKKASSIPYLEYSQRSGGIWKDSFAWKIALFMGLQSSLFYILISWLPEIMIDDGLNPTNAGFVLALFQLVAIPVSFTIPMFAIRFRRQSMIVLFVNILFIIGMIGLILQTNWTITLISVMIIGMGSSANFALSLLFLSIRAENAKDASELSGMAQSVGYIVAAFGPIVTGYLYDVTHNWTISLLGVIIILIAVLLFGYQAGKDKFVLQNK